MSIVSKPPPKGWPRLSVSVHYTNATKAIAFLEKAFGFECQLKVDGEGGTVVHSELIFGEAMIMLGDATPDKNRPWQQSPNQVGGANTQTCCLFVDNCDEHCERARAAGATIAMEPKTSDYGDDYWSDRTYEAIDHEGHHWWFMQRLREKA
ncbi:MAG TPA: VOC family protein [Kofleriaceae bacterium]